MPDTQKRRAPHWRPRGWPSPQNGHVEPGRGQRRGPVLDIAAGRDEGQRVINGGTLDGVQLGQLPGLPLEHPQELVLIPAAAQHRPGTVGGVAEDVVGGARGAKRDRRACSAATPEGHGHRPQTSPASWGSIQRKIYVGKDREFDPEPDAGRGERSIKKMAADEPARYSKNRQELYEYAEEKTETIGYVEKEQAWIRINDNELLVLGEHHAKTTLPDVVRAVGTKRWMHERYSELPLWIFEGHTNLAPAAAGAAARDPPRPRHPRGRAQTGRAAAKHSPPQLTAAPSSL